MKQNRKSLEIDLCKHLIFDENIKLIQQEELFFPPQMGLGKRKVKAY